MKKKIINILLAIVLISGSVFATWYFINSKEAKVSFKSFSIYGIEVDASNNHAFRINLENVDIKKQIVEENTCIPIFYATCKKGDNCLGPYAMGYDETTEKLHIYLTTGEKEDFTTSKALGTYNIYDYYIEVLIDKEKVKEAGYCLVDTIEELDEDNIEDFDEYNIED